MAQGILMAKARARNLRAMSISMGTLYIQNRQASPEAIEVCEEMDVDISKHRSQGLNLGILKMATHIFVMTHRHRDAVLALDPSLASKTILLGKYGSGPDEISDPIGYSSEFYREIRDQIEDSINGFLKTL